MRKAFKAILFVVTILLINSCINFLVTDDSASLSRAQFNDFYKEKTIDIVFVGSSFCRSTIDTSIIDEMCGLNSFNLGTSAQKIDDSYYLIREALNKKDIETVFLEVNPDFMQSERSDKDITSTYVISDYMSNSINKFKYLLDVTDEEDWINNIFLAKRNFSNIYTQGYVTDSVNHKLSKDYKEYKPRKTGPLDYETKGFTGSSKAVSDKSLFSFVSTGEYGDYSVTDYNLYYLRKIINFCHDNNVEIILFSAPWAENRIAHSIISGRKYSYDEFCTNISEISKKNNINYINLNLAKYKELDLDEADFFDYKHLNSCGATKVSKAVAKYINNEISYSEMFYPSWEEKSNDSPRNYGLLIDVEDIEDKYQLTISPLSSIENEKLEYRIYFEYHDGGKLEIQDYSENNIIFVSKKMNDKIKIQTRVIGTSKIINNVTIQSGQIKEVAAR